MTGIGPTAMMAACLGMGERHPEPRAGRLLDFAPVLRNREALGYILGYGAHCFELYGVTKTGAVQKRCAPMQL